VSIKYLKLNGLAFRSHHVQWFREMEKQEGLEKWKRGYHILPATRNQLKALRRHRIPVPMACTRAMADKLFFCWVMGWNEKRYLEL